MIDLHSHILPGIDDGAKTLEVSLAMARMAVADGIHTMACTPHIYPGMYMNDGPGIDHHRLNLQAKLDQAGIPLALVTGADVHLVPGLSAGLKTGQIPTLHRSRYFLLEPSHTVPPPRFEDTVFSLIVEGYVPVITHPERLTWIENHFATFERLIAQGAWMQVTAGALLGVFGARARYWGERFVGEGLTHILASDAHSAGRRSPEMSGAFRVAERLTDTREATKMVIHRPQAILHNEPPDAWPLPESFTPKNGSWLASVMRWPSSLRSKKPH